ncbi:MAG: hypothetical protein GEV08_03240, partial [Acidimicrobiia bacterium]|nr:hypothetical protein [Acidimicrobiia bacterium]
MDNDLTALLERVSIQGGFTYPDTKLSPPPRRSTFISRVDLIGPLADGGEDLVLVAAPAGYGKSTLLAEWVAAESRPSVWLSLDVADNDPVVLLTNLAIALSAVEPVNTTLVSTLWRANPKAMTAGLPRFGRALAGRRTPFVLVLDDTHVLVSPEALDVLAVLVAEVPTGSTLVLSGRALPPLPFGRLRPRSSTLRLGAADLAFSDTEASDMLDLLEVHLAGSELDKLVELTEGWPAALYLASLSLRGEPDTAEAVATFAGDDRVVAEYLKDELLDALDPAVSSFLLDASCLAQLTGPLCDEVLGYGASSERLEKLARDNSLVLPLDDHGDAYRLHHLLAELLQAELARKDPHRQVAIWARASRWFEEHGDLDSAVYHAVRSGDLDRAEAMVTTNFARWATYGRHATLKRWLALFDRDELAARPLLTIMAGYNRLAAGDGAGAAHWCARAEQAVPVRQDPAGPGWSPAVALAILRATISFGPVRDLVDDAAYAMRWVGEDDWRIMCSLLLGAGEFMGGDDEQAAAHFEDGRAGAAEFPNIMALCLAHRALVHVERDEWEEATDLARRGRDVLAEHGIEDVPNLFLVTAASCLVEARAGRVAEARADHLRTHRHLTGYLHQMGWANFQARIALARASILLGDRVGARTLLDEVEQSLARAPDAVRVVEQLESTRRHLAEPAEGAASGPSSLTTAALRVLHHLPSHLTLAE